MSERGTLGLVRYDAMVNAIEEARAIDEVKDIRDQATALQKYAQQAMNVEAEEKARQIRHRAERRAGEITRDMERATAGRPAKNSPVDATNSKTTKESALKAVGISKQQASQWERMAAIPKADFERAVREPGATTASIIGDKRPKDVSPPPKRTANDDSALWIWGRIRDLEQFCEAADAKRIAGAMTAQMRADARKALPAIIDWLTDLAEEIE